MARSKRLLTVLFVASLILLLGALPFGFNNVYVLHVLILLFMGVALGQSWNLIGGFAGQYSIGHAAYYGVGAYTTALLLQRAAVVPWVGVWLAMFLAMAVALVIGAICFRLRGPYFVLASIAVAEIMRLTALEWKSLTRGAEGILLSDLPTLKIGNWTVTDFTSKVPFYYLSLALALTTILICLATRNSKLGYCLLAIREDQDAAYSLGIPIGRYKNYALVISAALTSLVGSLYFLYVTFIDPGTVLGIEISIQAVLICIIGGIGTVVGPTLGAIVVVLLSEALRANLLAQGLFALGLVNESSVIGNFLKQNLAHAHALIYGILIIVVILFLPDGVISLARGKRNRSLRQPSDGPLTTDVPEGAPHGHS